MFHPLHDDPDVKIQLWELRQAKKAGLTVEAWREKERRAREAENARALKPQSAGGSGGKGS